MGHERARDVSVARIWDSSPCMRTTTIFASVIVLVPVITSAAPFEPDLVPARTANIGEFVASERTVDDIRFARQLLPSSGNISAVALSRVIYLNRAGVTL